MSNDRAGSEDDNLDTPTGAEEAADSAVEATDDAVESVAPQGASSDNDGIGDADFAPEQAEDDSDVSLEKVGVGAAAAGSARAAARRAGARSGVTEGKGAPTRARSEDEKRANVFSRIGRFLREVIAELGKVIWPSQKQMVTYTIVVIVFLIFMIALVSGLDLLFGWGVRSVFG